MELREFGITSNAIHPGAVVGDRIEWVLEGDIAALALFLTRPHGRTISGQLLPVDGDSKSTQ